MTVWLATYSLKAQILTISGLELFYTIAHINIQTRLKAGEREFIFKLVFGCVT